MTEEIPAWALAQGLNNKMQVEVPNGLLKKARRIAKRQGISVEELLSQAYATEMRATLDAHQSIHQPLDGLHR